jgi:hypothetical protein
MSQLFRWRTRLWPLAIVYFAQLLGFALLYSRLAPGSFAQLSAQMDPSYYDELKNAQDGLALEIQDDETLHPRLRELSERLKLGENYTLHVRLRPGADLPDFGNFAATIIISESASEYGMDMHLRVSADQKTPTLSLFRDCWDCPNEQSLIPKNAYRLSISAELYELLRKVYWQQRNALLPGFDYFDRFLYYSAVTSTTVGYGDIIPLSGWARLLCAGQSFVSIVLLGLFVNALWLTTTRPERLPRLP